MIDSAFFQQGETIDEFIIKLDDVRAKFETHAMEIKLSEKHLEQLTKLSAELRAMVIAEP